MKIDTIEALKILTYLQPILHKTELALERAKRERGYVVESELYVYRKGCAGLNSTYLFYKHPLTAYKATVFYWKTEAERCAGENYNENYDTDIRLVVTSASKFFQKAYDLLVNIYRFY